ncbi:MAG TPA: YukJ family protein [Blastocatellia bacterium]|nr:YukJ family protein [Blastocatellia bacterium]
MPLKKYGVLKGTALGHLRNADDDHYQILIKASGTLYRIAVNIKSAAKNAPSTLLFQTATTLPSNLKAGLRALNPGYKKLASKPGDLAQDYVRGGLVKPESMKPVPPDAPGADNDLRDKLEDALIKALAEPGSMVYAFGERWGPEKNKRDQYFKFTPGNGIHDIHMNQGNSGKWKKDNGVYQDGCIFIEYPGDKWRAFFFAFQSQTFDTDNKGNPRGGAPKLTTPKKKAKKAKKAKK